MMDSSGMMTRSRSRNTTIVPQNDPPVSSDKSDNSEDEDHLRAQGIESLTDSPDEMFKFATTCVLDSISKSNAAREEARRNITFIFDFFNTFEQEHVELQPRIADWRQSMYQSAGNNDIFKKIYRAGETERRIQRYEDRLQQAWSTPSADIIGNVTSKGNRSKHMLQLLAHLSEKVSKAEGMRLLNDARERRLRERGLAAKGFSRKRHLVTSDIKSAVDILKVSIQKGPALRTNQWGKRKRASGETASDRASSAATDDTEENQATTEVSANDIDNISAGENDSGGIGSEGRAAVARNLGHSLQGGDDGDEDDSSITQSLDDDVSVVVYATSSARPYWCIQINNVEQARGHALSNDQAPDPATYDQDSLLHDGVDLELLDDTYARDPFSSQGYQLSEVGRLINPSLGFELGLMMEDTLQKPPFNEAHTIDPKKLMASVHGAANHRLPLQSPQLMALSRQSALPTTDIEGALGTLQPKQWLSASVIDIILALSTPSDIRVIDSALLSAERLSGRQNLSPCELNVEKVYLPINHDTHWSLAIFDRRHHLLHVYDPISENAISLESPRHQIIKQVISALDLEADFPLSVARVPQQSNAYDCGIHLLITTIYDIANIRLPESFDCELWRRLFTVLVKVHADLNASDSSLPGTGSHIYATLPNHRERLVRSKQDLKHITSAIGVLATLQSEKLRTLQEMQERQVALELELHTLHKFISRFENFHHLREEVTLTHLLNRQERGQRMMRSIERQLTTCQKAEKGFRTAMEIAERIRTQRQEVLQEIQGLMKEKAASLRKKAEAFSKEASELEGLMEPSSLSQEWKCAVDEGRVGRLSSDT